MSSQDTTTLNTLIATTIDSANGFEEAARMANATGLASQFAELARDRWSIVETLEAEVQRLGDTPKRSGTAKAAAHRRWLDLKNAVSGSDRAVIQEVENGETYLVTKYETALAATGLSELTRRAIQEAFSEIRRGQERVRGLGLTVGTTEAARKTNVDWGRIGKGLGIAAAIGGAAFAASRMAQSRRTGGQTRRRGTTVSIDRTDRTEIEARNAEASTTGLSSDLDRDISGASSAGRAGGRRSAPSGTAGVGLTASGSTGSAMGTSGSAGLQGSGSSTGAESGGFQASGGTDDLSSGAGSTGSIGSTGGTGTGSGGSGSGGSGSGGFGR